MSQRPKTVSVPQEKRLVITVDVRKVEKQVRKPLPPPSQAHRNKSKYSRKPKHPTRED